MPGGSSLEAISRLREDAPGTSIVVLTMQDDPAFARQALRSGALGFVLKEAADEELLGGDPPRRRRGHLPQSAPRRPPRRRAHRARRPARRPHRTRARGPAPDRPRAHEHRDGAAAVPLHAHGRDPPRAHPAEAPPNVPRRARALRARAPARRDLRGAGRASAAGSGKFAGCARRSRASHRPTTSATTSSASSVAASAGAWLRTPPATSTSSATPTSTSDTARWKRPASECGHGSSGRTISRPWSESVHASLSAQPLQMCGLRAVAQQPPLVVDLVRPQVLALRAAPVVVLGVVLEAGGAVAQRAAVRVHRQPLEHAGGDEQEDRVPRGEDRFGRHGVVFAAAASSPIVATPAGSWISVNRMSSGSSSVVRLTV